jgi:hypothetical protein
MRYSSMSYQKLNNDLESQRQSTDKRSEFWAQNNPESRPGSWVIYNMAEYSETKISVETLEEIGNRDENLTFRYQS